MVSRPTPWPLDRISRVLLCSGGFPFGGLCPSFLEEDPKWSENLMKIYAQFGLPDLSDLLRVLHSCCWVAVLISSSLALVLRDYCPAVFCSKGAPKFPEGMICDCKQCPGKSFPDF